MNQLVPMLLADAAFSGILVLLWWMRRRYAFALYWGLGQIALALNTLGSSLGIGFGAAKPAGFPLSLLLAAPLLTMAILFYWRGCLHFCGRRFAPRRGHRRRNPGGDRAVVLRQKRPARVCRDRHPLGLADRMRDSDLPPSP